MKICYEGGCGVSGQNGRVTHANALRKQGVLWGLQTWKPCTNGDNQRGWLTSEWPCRGCAGSGDAIDKQAVVQQFSSIVRMCVLCMQVPRLLAGRLYCCTLQVFVVCNAMVQAGALCNQHSQHNQHTMEPTEIHGKGTTINYKTNIVTKLSSPFRLCGALLSP